MPPAPGLGAIESVAHVLHPCPRQGLEPPHSLAAHGRVADGTQGLGAPQGQHNVLSTVPGRGTGLGRGTSGENGWQGIYRTGTVQELPSGPTEEASASHATEPSCQGDSLSKRHSIAGRPPPDAKTRQGRGKRRGSATRQMPRAGWSTFCSSTPVKRCLNSIRLRALWADCSKLWISWAPALANRAPTRGRGAMPTPYDSRAWQCRVTTALGGRKGEIQLCCKHPFTGFSYPAYPKTANYHIRAFHTTSHPVSRPYLHFWRASNFCECVPALPWSVLEEVGHECRGRSVRVDLKVACRTVVSESIGDQSAVLVGVAIM